MTDPQGIFKALRELSEPSVLATLVGVEGSTYRKAGARMLFGTTGSTLGCVSAGCLEADVQARVQQVLESGEPLLVRYDMGVELDLVWGTGMGCDGRAQVLLEPILPGRLAPWIHFCGQQLDRRRSCVLATVLAVEGEAMPYSLGDRFAFDDHSHHGLLPIDAGLSVALSRASAQVLETDQCLRQGFPVPGGQVELLIEPLRPPVALWIFGAGENARPLARMAKQLGWFVGILDHRPALATPERFPEADRVSAGRPSELIDAIPLDGRSAAVVLSHVYDRDREALESFLSRGAAFVGLQGNRKRSEKLLAELEAAGRGLAEEARERLFYPMGLDLGAEAPEGIALSVLAEVQAVLAGRSGGHLRDRRAPIHG
jgi:xanthine/CO dehydrogenase XdhC/CoxF family maturation factor